MSSVLAIDAAWTAGEPSGVALLQEQQGAWHCLGVAPCYADFVGLSRGNPVNWAAARIAGAAPNVPELLQAAKRLLGGDSPDIVAIDMPVATVPIVSRRLADDLVSQLFGGRGCSCHTPSLTRPGPLGASVTTAFSAEGYPIATAASQVGSVRRLIEVYPHPALLTLVNSPFRFAYKISKSNKLWPGTTRQVRISNLILAFNQILAALGTQIQGIGLALPAAQNVKTLVGLKRYEDALDALISAWVGCRYLAGNAGSHGDHTAAIWIP